MICWSCQKNVAATEFCSACGAILPLDGRPDHFTLIGAPMRFSQDMAALERRYKESTRAVHPDKFARADAQARRAAMQRTVALNEAWRTLRDPIARAEYLVRLLGIDVGTEDGTLRRTETGQEKVAVDPTLLADMMEKREALMEAREQEDYAALARLARQVRASYEQALLEAQTALDRQAAGDTERAAKCLVAVRYYRRFLDSFEDGGHASPGAQHG
ncbi:MAG: Fe-S protein assembly co-chaperone HscB [Deltaproteobacteria bacterium]|nr:Fe-S protein assembly co-chaperone HscB [Deltaproteobacteria bacterium]